MLYTRNGWNIHKIEANCYNCELIGVATYFHHPSRYSGDRTCVRIATRNVEKLAKV